MRFKKKPHYNINPESVDYFEEEGVDRFDLDFINEVYPSSSITRPTPLPANSLTSQKKPPTTKWKIERNNIILLNRKYHKIDPTGMPNNARVFIKTQKNKCTTKESHLNIKDIINFFSNNSNIIISVAAIFLVLGAITIITLGAICPQTISFMIAPALNLTNLNIICGFAITTGVLMGSKVLFFTSQDNSEDDDITPTQSYEQLG